MLTSPSPQNQQDTAGSGQLQGLQAVTFFKLSGLDVSILKNIWAIADARGNHFLSREVCMYVCVHVRT